MKLGIIGGTGPISTAYFYKRLLEYGNFERDQDHIRIIIDSNSKIPDRNKYLLTGKDHFLDEILKSRDGLIAQGCDVIVMHSTSAHCIYDELVDGRAKYLNMIKIAMSHMKNKGFDRLLVISTKGAAISKIFDKYSNGMDVIYPNEKEMMQIDKWIVDLKKGKKIVSKDTIDTIYSISKRHDNVPVLIACSELDRLFYDVIESYNNIFIASDELIKKIYMM